MYNMSKHLVRATLFCFHPIKINLFIFSVWQYILSITVKWDVYCALLLQYWCKIVIKITYSHWISEVSYMDDKQMDWLSFRNVQKGEDLVKYGSINALAVRKILKKVWQGLFIGTLMTFFLAITSNYAIIEHMFGWFLSFIYLMIIVKR